MAITTEIRHRGKRTSLIVPFQVHWLYLALSKVYDDGLARGSLLMRRKLVENCLQSQKQKLYPKTRF
jgi:hypothetical protein